MKSDLANFSTSWVPHCVAFSRQVYYTHFGTGEVVLAGAVPLPFKVADIVPADTISSPEDGANLSESHRAALITGTLPLAEVTLPSMQLKLGTLCDAGTDFASAEAAVFQKLGIDVKTADPDPVLMLLVRIFFLDKSLQPEPPLPQRPPSLPPLPEKLLLDAGEGASARQHYAEDVLHLQLPCKIATVPRSLPLIVQKQVCETNALLLSFKGVKFEFNDGIPLEPMFCSAVLVSRAGDGEFLSQTFHFDAVDEDLLRKCGAVALDPLTRNKDVLLQLSSLPHTSSVWLVVIVEKSMGFHTQRPYKEARTSNVEELKQRMITNCMLYGKYRRPFVWGFTEIYSRNIDDDSSANWNPLDSFNPSFDPAEMASAAGAQRSPSTQTWQMGNIEISNLYPVSDFCEHFSKPFSIFESMNRLDLKRKQYARVGGSLQFVLQPWSDPDFSSPGPHSVSSIAERESENKVLNCFLYRPSISLRPDTPPNVQNVVFMSHEPSLHSHMRCLRCYDDLFNSLYISDLSVNLHDVKVKKNFGERDNYVIRISFKESDLGEEDGLVPAMVMKSSLGTALSTEAFTHVAVNVNHPHFIDQIRVELRPQLHCNSHLLITLMRVARRSRVSTLFKSAPSLDDQIPDVIVGHAVLKFSNSQELAACCSSLTMLPLMESPLKPGYLNEQNNTYLAGKNRVLQCQLRLQSSLYPATPLMAQMFTSLCSFHELSVSLHQFIVRDSGLSLTCARRDLETEISDISAALLQLTTSVDLLEIVAFFPAVATFLIHVICASHHFYLYEKSRDDSFAQAQPLAVLCSQLSRQSLLSLMYFVNGIARCHSELNFKKSQMMPEASPAGVSERDGASSSNRNDRCDIIGSDEHLVPNILWFAHRVFDDSATFACTGLSSSVLLAEVWSRSLQEQLLSPRMTSVMKADSQDSTKFNKESTCSIAWFMFSLIRKGMLLHLQRNGLNSDGFAPNSSHPVRKMLVEFSLEIINTLTSFLLVSFVDDWPSMDHDAITTRCFNHMVLFIRDCGPMFGSAFVVTSMQSILLKIKQHTDPDPRTIFTFKAQIRLLELLYNTPHFLILNRLATLDSATPLDPVMLMRHCGHFALLCAYVDELRNSPFDESNYCESFKLAWDVLLRVDSMELSVDRDLRQKIAMLFWPLLCSILSLYHQNVNFFQIWSQPMRAKLFTMCLFVIANVPRPNLMKWLENQTDSCLISFIDLLKDIFAIIAPIYSYQKDTGQDSNAMLVSALSILSYVVLSPELGSERETDRILQQRSGKPAAATKKIAREAEQLLGVSRDASDSCLWLLLNVLCSLLDAVALRHPSRRTASVEVSTLRNDALGSWELLNSHCFSAIKSCALRFDLLVASCDSVTLKFEKSPTEDENSPLFCLSAARLYYIDILRKYISVVGLNENDWRELFLLNLQNICSTESEFIEFGNIHHRLLSNSIPNSVQTDKFIDFRFQRVALDSAESLVLDSDVKSLVSIQGGTVNALVSVLLSRSHPSNTPMFKTFFFMWYCLKPLKISAEQLLACFVFELESAIEQRMLPHVIHVVGLILKWMEDYIEDFGADLLSKLVDLCQKWKPLFLSLCSFDFSSQILFQLYRKSAWVLKDLKREIDSRHFTPLEPESVEQEDTEDAGQNEPADASRLLAMALAVAVSEAPKSAASQELDEVARAIITLSTVPTSADIAAASNAIDQPGLCTCILLELGPEQIANILTKSFFDTFCNIPPRDFARKALGESSGRYPKYTKATRNSERLSHWIRCMVLMEGRLDVRRKLCSLFVEVCNCFLQRNDFNGLAAVYTGGLSSAPIYRLKKTTGIFTYKEDEKVPRDEFESIFEQSLAEKYEAVKLAMSTDKNFTNYRQWLEKADLPCFPYMGLFVTDATFAWDGKGEKPMKFPENCIDIRRCTKVAGIVISNLMLYQKHQYSFEVDPDAEKKLFATFNAPLLLRLEQSKEKNANAYTCSIFLLMNLSQDDLCIQLSKNIEHEERKTFPAPSAMATSDAAAQAALALSRTAAAPSSAVLPPPPVDPKTPRVAVAFPSPTLSNSAVPPPSSAVPASSQPPTAAASPAASANP